MLFAPKGLPEPIKTCFKTALTEVVKSAEYKKLMDKFENEALDLGEDGLKNLLGKTAAFYKEASRRSKDRARRSAG